MLARLSDIYMEAKHAMIDAAMQGTQGRNADADGLDLDADPVPGPLLRLRRARPRFPFALAVRRRGT
jgi:hypothetical protein